MPLSDSDSRLLGSSGEGPTIADREDLDGAASVDMGVPRGETKPLTKFSDENAAMDRATRPPRVDEGLSTIVLSIEQLMRRGKGEK